MTFIDLCAGIGNAVVPQLVEVIGRAILAASRTGSFSCLE